MRTHLARVVVGRGCQQRHGAVERRVGDARHILQVTRQGALLRCRRQVPKACRHVAARRRQLLSVGAAAWKGGKKKGGRERSMHHQLLAVRAAARGLGEHGVGTESEREGQRHEA
eukprot:364688-Chlamydomonas_euryale.AAC.4